MAVIGAGISGLAAAHRLQELFAGREAALQLKVYEAASRAGGVMATCRRDGFLVEEGPDSFITERPWAVRLVERLGLGGHLIGTRSQFRRSFIVGRGRLHPTPDGFYLLSPARILPLLASPLLSPLGKLRAGLDLVLPACRDPRDESLGAFVRRRLGREVLDRMAQPMISSIYGADPMSLSLLATFPRFRQWETDHGSIIRALRARARRRVPGAATSRAAPGAGSQAASGPRYGLFVTLDGGLQLLTEALVSRLPAGALRTGVRIDAVQRAREGRWMVRGPGLEEPADRVIVALPGPAAARVLRSTDEILSRCLSQIDYGAAAIIALGYREADVDHPLDGFGFVTPAREGLSLLGCTFAHRKFAGRAPEGHALLRVFHGDASRSLSDQEITQATLRDLRCVLGAHGEPRFVTVCRHPRALPRYGVGHLERVDRIETRLRACAGLALAGNAYRGIGLPDCVHSGEEAAESVLAAGLPENGVPAA